jgi:hypothetical protein
MTGRSLALFALAALLASCGTGDGDSARDAGAPYVKVHSLQQLMDTVMEPDAQIFWHSSGTVSDTAGTRDLTPTTAERWAAAQSAAATVAETGNLLVTPMFAQDRGPDWIAFAQDLARAGKDAEKAAIDRDGVAMFDAGAKLSEACSACHQAYLPQEQAARADSVQ